MITQAQQRLADWFRQWHSPVRKLLSRRGIIEPADLDDIAQEVFLRLLRYDRAELVEHPQAYLLKMASNVADEWAIRARVRHSHDAKWLDDLLADDRPDQVTAQHAAQEEVERALGTLPPRQREVLKLRFADGLGCAEIAKRLGCTPRIVKRDLAKSYAKLRTKLDADLIGALNHGSD